ncbi:hypothetical protein Agabi119p4_4635 [Agaricus bisporus var. burnettii]|uniref:Phospholipid/glycerol acyltransferase domain-containing protein n=1 Tax=Agaricus bisporus var. burnettii TaxID=192524 RepID=A0A8H7F3M7_AGABI|nr:hypothetical protein Agabi119p4_4635 [Agaricus bisporus var. burnettii]
MEKFSAWPSIHPFLTPLPPTIPSNAFQAVLHLLGLVLGAFRLAVVLFTVVLYVILVEGVCLLFSPAPPLYRALKHALTFILANMTLFSLGIYRMPVEITTRKRAARASRYNESWNPSKGDLIISNWASWIEIVWLAARYNPIFVLPVPETTPRFERSKPSSSHITNRPGRATGTGSAGIHNAPKHSAVDPIPIKGFREVSLLKMIYSVGAIPPYFDANSNARPLKEIRRSARRPIVVFPECTTSNGRGMLRFAKVFNEDIPVKGCQVFVMCVRYDPPTSSAPTLTYATALSGSTLLGLVSHAFRIACFPFSSAVSIRLLAPSESPSSQLFIASDHIKGTPGEDPLAEASANLISQIGRLKRTGMGWEDKASFLHYQDQKQK